MKRILLRSIAVLVGIAVGCAAGGYLTFHTYSQKYATVRYFAWAGIFAAVSEGQYDKNTSDAKQDLLNTLALYDRGVQSSNIDPTLKKSLCMNRGLIEARLSVLEDEGGDADRAKSDMSKAQEDLKAAGWVDRSEANILQAVRRQPVSPCGIASESTAKAIASTNQKPCG
jgi:hypothetical protein